jgi:threonyl-tRNA synthetase
MDFVVEYINIYVSTNEKRVFEERKLLKNVAYLKEDFVWSEVFMGIDSGKIIFYIRDIEILVLQ